MRKIILITIYALTLFNLSFTTTASALKQDASKRTLAPMLKKVMPSVVSITGYKKTKVNNIQNPNIEAPIKEESASVMIGSGVIIDAKKGLIATNSHVVAGLEEVKVTLIDNRKYLATILGQDQDSDLALLKIDADNLTQIPYADSDNIQVGDFVVAIGTPYGMKHTVTSGIISALGRNDIGFDGYYDFIQTDAAINLGNSGGGLFNTKGELVGINTAIISPTNNPNAIPGNIGLGLAIPTNMARGILGQLANNGHVDRGPLGVRAQNLTPELAKGFNLKLEKGAVVIEVIANTSADKAGIQMGDVIYMINDKIVKDPAHMRTLISMIPIGRTAKVQFFRQGKDLTKEIVITNPLDHLTKGEKVFSGLKGSSLEELNINGNKGLLIAKIEKDSPIANSELQEGDIIVGANYLATPNIEVLAEAATKNKEALLLKIVRKDVEFFAAVLTRKN